MAQNIQINNTTYTLVPSVQPTFNNDPYLQVFLGVVAEQKRVDAMKWAFNLKGGWEIWLQVEAGTYLSGYVGKAGTGTREELVWPASQNKVDIWMAGPGETRSGFELKCRNINSKDWTTAAAFTTLFMADVLKADTTPIREQKADNSGNIPISMYAVAITNDPRDLVVETKSVVHGTYHPPLSQHANINYCQFAGPQGYTVAHDLTAFINDANNAPRNNLYMLWYKKSYA